MLSIEKSKKILGEEYNNFSDDEIQEVIDSSNMFADIFIEGFLDVREVNTDEE